MPPRRKRRHASRLAAAAISSRIAPAMLDQQGESQGSGERHRDSDLPRVGWPPAEIKLLATGGASSKSISVRV
jgi:hypothetical protein